MSELKVNKVSPRSGTTVTIGDSGDTINLVGTVQNNGSPLPGDISSVTAGTGLSGGGSTGDVTLNLDLNELTTSTSDADGDFFAVVDAANAQKKLTKGNINISGFNNDSGFIDGSSLNADNLSSGTVPDARITGTYTGITGLDLGDNNKIRLGTGNDTELYNDGSSFYLDNYNGNIQIRTFSDDRDIFLVSDDGSGGNASYLQADGSTGSINLRHYGNVKLATTSSGVDVTGNLTASGNLTSTGIDDNASSTAITIDGSNDVGIGTNSPGSYRLNVTDTANTNIRVTESTNNILLDLRANTTGGLLRTTTNHPFVFGIYQVEKMRLTSTGLGINTSSPGTKLDVRDGARGIRIKSTGDTGYTQGSMLIEGHESNSTPGNRGQGIYLFNHGNNLNWYMGTTYQGAGDFAICSLSDTAQQNSTADDDNSRLVIDTSGNVGINTKTPTERLHVFDGASSGTVSVDIANFQQSSNDSGGGALSLATAIKIGGTTRYAQIKGLHNQYASAATALSFWTDNGTNTEKMRLTNSGSLGIGTTSPSGSDFGSQTGLVHIKDVGGINTGIKLEQGAGKSFWYQNATNTFFGSGSSHPLRIYTGQTERMRIDSSGKVGINTTSPQRFLHITGNDGASGTTAGNSDSQLFIDNAGGNGAMIEFGASNTGAGRIQFSDEDSTNQGKIEYFHSSDHMQFSTNASERMRIDSSGQVSIGSTSTNARLFCESNNDSISTFRLNDTSSGSAGKNIAIFQRRGTNVGFVNVTDSSTSFVTSSDHRLKENVVDMTNATTRLKQLSPKRFNFIVDADTTVDGFLAHEVSSVVPEAVTGTHNEVDADGNPVYQGIDQSKLVPLLVKTIQELEARITALEANNP